MHSSVGEATKLMFDLKRKDGFSSNESIGFIVDDFLNPLRLAAGFFNHKFQIDDFTSYEQQLVPNFIDETLNSCVEDTTSISDYMLKTNDFRRIFEKAEVINPRQFWVRATLKYQKLASFALELLAIPGFLPKLSVPKIYKVVDNYGNYEKMMNLLIALLLEDLR